MLVAWSGALRHVTYDSRQLIDNVLWLGFAFLIGGWSDIRVAVSVAGVVRHLDHGRFDVLDYLMSRIQQTLLNDRTPRAL